MEPRDGVAAYILAGGASSRMGRDKALLAPGGVPVILRIAGIVAPLTGPPVIIGSPARYSALGYDVVADDVSGVGPLGGIATALRYSFQPWNLILGCDLPFLSAQWLEYLIERAIESNSDAVVPKGPAGAEPLCAMYRKTCVTPIREAIACGVRKVTDAFAGLAIDFVLPAHWKAFDDDGQLFKNMNTPGDFEAADAIFGRRSGGEA